VKTVATFEEVRRERRGRTGLVPTMGYLHDGHLSLMRTAREVVDTVIASIFVNPLQFGEGEDLDRYPRDLERDAVLADEVGVDVLFAPSLDEMYPQDPMVRVVVGHLADHLCGAYRPGHFEGVATVVAKLFVGIQPDVAFFGRKDAQQLVILRRLALDLSFPVEVVGCPIVREPDGVAMSSRNVYLSNDQRVSARALSMGLALAVEAVAEGERSSEVLIGLVRDECEGTPGVDVQYVEMVDADTLQPIVDVDRDAILAVAAFVGSTRLIDNAHLRVEGNEVRSELGTRRGA
jgi:pantoate--beta-alanine ligase